jgi:hypothetical protein
VHLVQIHQTKLTSRLPNPLCGTRAMLVNLFFWSGLTEFHKQRIYRGEAEFAVLQDFFRPMVYWSKERENHWLRRGCRCSDITQEYGKSI